MKAILLLSGGADSALLLHEQKPVLAIGYDYGQLARIELRYAKRLADSCNVPFELFILPELPFVDGGVVRAGRNAVMLAHAAAIAQARGFDTVMIGCNATDAGRFPDCRADFISAISRAFWDAYTVGVLAPLIDMLKPEILARCRAAGITETWSCYTPVDGKPCGECYACEQSRSS